MRSRVPHGWQRVPLGALLTEVKRPVSVSEGNVYQEIGIRSHGKGIFIKAPISGKDLGNKKVFYVQPDAIIANIVFAWEGAIARSSVEHDGLIASHRFPMWVPKPERCILPFLDYLLRSPEGIRLAFLSSPGGAGRNKTLNQKDFLRSRILLPPLAEQRKIADILTSVDNTVLATEALIEQTRKVKAGLLQDILTKGVNHTVFQKTPWGSIPSSWNLVKLKDVAQVRSGATKNSGKEYLDPMSVAYLRVANVQDGYLDLSEVKNMTIERSDLEKYRLKVGDVLMNEGGDIDKLGRGDVWHGQIEPCVHQNHVFSVRCGPRILPSFLNYLGESPWGKAYFAVAGKQTTNLASINKTQLSSLPVPLPDLEEQGLICAWIDGVRDAIKAYEKEFHQLKCIRVGLLQDLLTGKVRVTP